MRRPFVFYLLVVLVLAAFGGFAWLTRHPDAEILRQAASWPWVGPVASRFRQAYGVRDDATGPGGRPTEQTAAPETASEPIAAPPTYRRHVWVLIGMELKAGPSVDAATVYTFERLARAGKIENRGDWYHVDYYGRVGWVWLEGYDESAVIPYGERPEPVHPVSARPPDEDVLAAARRYLRRRQRAAALGPYTFYTDSQDSALISLLHTVAGRLESVYAERYRRPIGVAAEAVVLYQSDIAYRLVQRQTERIAGLHSAGHNTQGVAVLYSGGRSRADIAGTLIHELTHFLNRRALGPQLPPWLDEGICDDLALSRIEADGSIDPRGLSGGRRRQGDKVTTEGGLAALWQLRDALREGTLPAAAELMGADWDGFVQTPKIQLHYAAAAFWIRYLIDGEDGRHAAGFRSFLDAVAAGEPSAGETLGARLDEDWDALDIGFRAWIEERAESAGLPST